MLLSSLLLVPNILAINYLVIYPSRLGFCRSTESRITLGSFSSLMFNSDTIVENSGVMPDSLRDAETWTRINRYAPKPLVPVAVPIMRIPEKCPDLSTMMEDFNQLGAGAVTHQIPRVELPGVLRRTIDSHIIALDGDKIGLSFESMNELYHYSSPVGPLAVFIPGCGVLPFQLDLIKQRLDIGALLRQGLEEGMVQDFVERDVHCGGCLVKMMVDVMKAMEEQDGDEGERADMFRHKIMDMHKKVGEYVRGQPDSRFKSLGDIASIPAAIRSAARQTERQGEEGEGEGEGEEAIGEKILQLLDQMNAEATGRSPRVLGEIFDAYLTAMDC